MLVDASEDQRERTCRALRAAHATTLLAQDSLGQGGLGHLAWPGTQDGLGQGRLRLKWAKGRFRSKIDEQMKVLRMGLPIVESLSGPQESIFNLSRGPQLHFAEKSKNWTNFVKFTDFPPFPLFGVPWAAIIFPPQTVFIMRKGVLKLYPVLSM